MSTAEVACWTCGQVRIACGGLGCICKTCSVCETVYQEAGWALKYVCPACRTAAAETP